MSTGTQNGSSHSLCVTFTLGVPIFPVVHLSNSLALTLKDFFILWVFISTLIFCSLLASLSFPGFSNFAVSELLKRHGWQIVARLEDLFLVLAAQVHPIVDVSLFYCDALNLFHCGEGVLVGVNDSTLTSWISTWLHHVWQVLHIIWANKHSLKRLHIFSSLGCASSLVRSNLLGSESGLMSMNLHLHLSHWNLLERIQD